MVSTLMKTNLQQTAVSNRGAVVELIGVAGVGKSTLYKTLKTMNLPWLICDRVMPVWSISSIPFFMKNIFLLTPVLVQSEIKGERLLKRREIAFLAMLNGWHSQLRKKADQQAKTILLDQGPISMMAYLSVWGPQSLKYAHIQNWWESVYKKWAHTLDYLVYLDTKDEIIMERIRARSQNHHLKKETDEVMYDWIMRYRWLYTQILSRFESNGHKVKVVNIESGLNPVEDIVNFLIPVIHNNHNHNNV